jgi:hypothetical protein
MCMYSYTYRFKYRSLELVYLHKESEFILPLHSDRTDKVLLKESIIRCKLIPCI